MSEYNIKDIGGRIRTMREKTGYSRERLSELAEITPKFLYEIEAGKKGMSAYTLYNISKSLDISCDYILTGKTANGNLDYIINILSSLDDNRLAHMERIIKHISAML